MKRTVLALSTVFCVGTVFAQVETRRAMFTGSRGEHGKCTIEVEVDGAAEVEIRGAEGRIRTLYGSPANWRRFQCNDTLPRNPEEFRFRGIDGRGSQNLIREPRQTGGVAVIRIEDPKGGREGYTFDIEWRGYAGGMGGGGGWDRGDNNRRWEREDERWNPGLRRGNEGGRPSREAARDAIETCKNAVAARASSQYGVDRVNFTRAEVDNNPGRRDWIVGTFNGRRGNMRGDFSFTCSVDLSSGEVRRANITPIER